MLTSSKEKHCALSIKYFRTLILILPPQTTLLLDFANRGGHRVLADHFWRILSRMHQKPLTQHFSNTTPAGSINGDSLSLCHGSEDERFPFYSRIFFPSSIHAQHRSESLLYHVPFENAENQPPTKEVVGETRLHLAAFSIRHKLPRFQLQSNRWNLRSHYNFTLSQRSFHNRSEHIPRKTHRSSEHSFNHPVPATPAMFQPYPPTREHCVSHRRSSDRTPEHLNRELERSHQATVEQFHPRSSAFPRVW